ncbi:MAG: aminoacyl-tRNA hydrolase [Elusimicrobia bacterium]|nr:aminoacyl-tRNA hydrolase [Elusimicrobiota bacterium]
MAGPQVLLVVGLGNPGERYAGTRHNVGFRTADRLLERAGGRWEAAAAGEGEAARAVVGGREVWLAKPMTYMNESGRMAAALARFYKIPPASVLVVSDDIDLPLGRLRIRLKGSSGGQRGLESVLTHLGTTDVPRLRLGVGPRPAETDAAAFVLGRFRPDEREAAEALVDRAADAAESCVEKGVEAAMNLYNAAAA